MNGQRGGVGKLYHDKKGLIYEGNWKKDLPHGSGVLKNIQPFYDECINITMHLESLLNFWTQYEGYFKDGLPHGNGVILIGKEDKFIGTFV